MPWKTLLLLSVLAFEVAASRAAGASPATPGAPTFTATGAIASEYMFRGLRRNGASFQPGIEAESGPLTLGAWSNLPFHHKVRNGADPEIDLYGAYAFTVAQRASIVPGFTAYWYPDPPAAGHRATFEPSLAFNYTIPAGVRFTPKIYYDTVLKGATYEFTAAYAYPVGWWGTELDFTGSVGTYRWTDYAQQFGADAKAWGDYWLLGVGVPFQIGPSHKITLNFTYTEGRNTFTKHAVFPRASNPLGAGRGVLTLSYSYIF